MSRFFSVTPDSFVLLNLKTSLPKPPVNLSAPLPPISVSFPCNPLSMSLPVVPVSWSLPLVLIIDGSGLGIGNLTSGITVVVLIIGISTTGTKIFSVDNFVSEKARTSTFVNVSMLPVSLFLTEIVAASFFKS